MLRTVLVDKFDVKMSNERTLRFLKRAEINFFRAKYLPVFTFFELHFYFVIYMYLEISHSYLNMITLL